MFSPTLGLWVWSDPQVVVPFWDIVEPVKQGAGLADAGTWSGLWRLQLAL